MARLNNAYRARLCGTPGVRLTVTLTADEDDDVAPPVNRPYRARRIGWSTAIHMAAAAAFSRNEISQTAVSRDDVDGKRDERKNEKKYKKLRNSLPGNNNNGMDVEKKNKTVLSKKNFDRIEK